jgi:siroheme synthase-like protein
VKDLLPLFLRLENRRAVVVGGGAMAAQRVRQLAAAGARVVVVAPEVRPEIVPLAEEVHRRPFVAPDLNGAWLCVAAAPPGVNREVARAAEARRVFVNAVDDVAAASAYCAGIMRKGGVVLAVSTEGRAPALAGLLREALEALLPADVAAWTALAEKLRPAWKAAKVPMGERRPLLLRALNALYGARQAGGEGLPPPRPAAAPSALARSASAAGFAAIEVGGSAPDSPGPCPRPSPGEVQPANAGRTGAEEGWRRARAPSPGEGDPSPTSKDPSRSPSPSWSSSPSASSTIEVPL